MISLDMKYTSLYWTLRFVENDLDVHTKDYNGYKISIYAEEQRVDYGSSIESCNNAISRHKDFVILECVDRLLQKGYSPEQIKISSIKSDFDILVESEHSEDIAIKCENWGSDYERSQSEFNEPFDYPYSVLYTSRLVSGLLEYKSTILSNEKKYSYGIFEDDARLTDYNLKIKKAVKIEQVVDITDFEIVEDELVRYIGKSKSVKVPEGITTIGASAFWNRTTVDEILLPQSLRRLGGDAFYYCANLKDLTIPKQVWIMGNDPFAGCPKLVLKNQSPHFILSDGVLFNKAMDNLIHYSPNKLQTKYIVPNSVTCLGKHCFYNAKNLEQLIIPSSVIRFENNPFSGCDKLKIENHSSHYHIVDGVIYNKFMTTIIGVLCSTQMDCLVVPNTVTLISRNSFWNCKGIKKIVLTENITRIGYNPFASCENLKIESVNHRYKVEDNVLYNEDMTELICCTNKGARNIQIPKSIKKINRSAFSGCFRLVNIDLNNVEIIDKSAFTNCINLTEIYFKDNLLNIGEWAFAYCSGLKKASVCSKTKIDRNAFDECPVDLEVRK